MELRKNINNIYSIFRAPNAQKEKPAVASSFPWDESNRTEDEKLTAWMVAENGNLILDNHQQA